MVNKIIKQEDTLTSKGCKFNWNHDFLFLAAVGRTVSFKEKSTSGQSHVISMMPYAQLVERSVSHY